MKILPLNSLFSLFISEVGECEQNDENNQTNGQADRQSYMVHGRVQRVETITKVSENTCLYERIPRLNLNIYYNIFVQLYTFFIHCYFLKQHLDLNFNKVSISSLHLQFFLSIIKCFLSSCLNFHCCQPRCLESMQERGPCCIGHSRNNILQT